MLTFQLFCVTLIALLFGTIVTFGGYRLFLVLLPIWGFFFGFGVGAQSVQLLFGENFLATVTGWVVGFIVALVFSLLSYLFYVFAVGMIAGSLGYGLGVGLVGLVSSQLNFVAWLVGMALAVVFIVVTFRFDLAKYMIIAATSIGGAAAVVATLALGVENVQFASLVSNPGSALFNASFIWTFLFFFMFFAGSSFQLAVNRQWEIETYNRWEQMQAG
jgi:hypothetical protein